MFNFLRPHELQHTRLLSSNISWSLLKSCPLSWWCRPTILSSVIAFSFCLQSFPAFGSFPKNLCIRWPKYWSFSFSISPSNVYSGLISSRIDWFDLLAAQGTLKSLFQHHNSKVSILWHSTFYMIQLSHPYMTTGKTIPLTRQTFVGKGMSLLFNMLSGFVIAFLPMSKRLLISWLQSPSAVILEPKKIKSVTASTFSPSICHEARGLGTMILVFFSVEFQASFFTLIFHPHQKAF